MRWTAQIRVFFSKSKCLSVILICLCTFFVYTMTRRLPSGFITKGKGGKPSSSLSSETSSKAKILEDAFDGDYVEETFLTTSQPMIFPANDDVDAGETTSTVSNPPPFSPPSHVPSTALRAHTVDFDPHGSDVLVMLHTQKTGGSEFLRHLVTVKREGHFLCLLPSAVMNSIMAQGTIPKNQHHRERRRAANNPTSCPRNPSRPYGEQWLVAEKTMGWVCGLHASYIEYQNCLLTLSGPRFKFRNDLKLHFAILLRHPVLRYLSEYLHVQRSATWTSHHMCGGKVVSPSDMPPCYPGFYLKKPWPNLTLSSFVSCESNWGNNRQTMMLADLELVHCYDKSAMSKEERDRRLLESAKANLRSFAFFGLTEYMPETYRLFEETFGMTFAVPPGQRNVSELHSAPMLTDLWSNSDIYQAILRANHLDVQLYDFALELFSERAEAVGITVNKDLVEQAVKDLQVNPYQVNKVVEKYRRINYKVS